MEFRVPDTQYADETYDKPSAHRHYLVLRDAMQAEDTKTVGNRQIRLLRAGFEIPITIDQCNRILEKYRCY